MKKIAFITPSYYPAILTGSGVVVLKLAEQFAKEGYDVSVITSNALMPRYWYDPFFGKKVKKTSEIHHGVKIHRLLCNQFYSSIYFILIKIFGKLIPKFLFNRLVIEAAGPYLLGLEKLITSEKYDVVHCSPSPLAINAQIVRILKGMIQKPTFILTPFFHSELGDFANPELKKILNAADKIHTITDAEKEKLHNMFGINKKKIVVVPLFLDTDGIYTSSQLQTDIKIFKKHHALEKRKIILFAGIKGYAKGATNVLSAMDRLYKQNHEYILVAMGTDTPEWNQAKKRIDPHCLLDFEYKTGKEKEILFGACEIFCMPSKSESFGLVYLEAWAKKKPVIAAAISAVEEFLKKNAVYVAFGNIQQTEKKIQKLCDDKNTQKKLGENGYNTLMEMYTFKKIFPKYEQLFTQ